MESYRWTISKNVKDFRQFPMIRFLNFFGTPIIVIKEILEDLNFTVLCIDRIEFPGKSIINNMTPVNLKKWPILENFDNTME